MADLYFCTVCGESVPQTHLDSGEAVRAGERCVCPSCRGLLDDARSGGSGAAGWVAGLLAVVALAAAGWSWWTAERADEQLWADTRDAFDAQADGYDDRLEDRVQEILDAVDRSAGLTSAQIQELGGRLDRVEEEIGQRLDTLTSETEQLAQLALEIEALGRRLGKVEAEVTIARERQEEQRGVQEGLRARMETLEAELRDLESRGPAAGEESAAEFPPRIAGLVTQLRSPDQDERLEALERLADQEDARLVPHILPLLTDPYEFNRFYAAKTLGDWRAKPAVPNLIEALLDEIPFVRQAAVQALRPITGQNFGYDPQGEEAARRRSYELWKTWWSTNGSSFLES